jgi:hypothetical protein
MDCLCLHKIPVKIFILRFNSYREFGATLTVF